MSNRNRPVNDLPTMTQALVAEKERNGYSKKLYKSQSDAHKGDQLQTDIANRIVALQETTGREKVDFANLEQVKERTYLYLEACREASVFPSVMGLAVHGFGVSRQALNQYLLKNNNATTDFIELTKDVIADILTNASLYNNANTIASIFQLKNSHAFSDKVEIQAVAPHTELQDYSIDDIRTRYVVDTSSDPADE